MGQGKSRAFNCIDDMQREAELTNRMARETAGIAERIQNTRPSTDRGFSPQMVRHRSNIRHYNVRGGGKKLKKTKNRKTKNRKTKKRKTKNKTKK